MKVKIVKPEKNDVLISYKVSERISEKLNRLADRNEVSLAEYMRQVSEALEDVDFTGESK